MKTKPIAARQLHAQGNKDKLYAVEVYKPIKIDDGTFRCKVRIEGAPDGLCDVDIGGQDSYEALMLAIQAIPEMVNIFNKQFMDSKLRWFSDDEDLHFALSLMRPDKNK